MQNLDLKKVLTGDDTQESNPILNDRFEIKDLNKTTTTSKIYTGYDLVTDTEVIIKFRHGRAREQFVDGYSYIDEDGVPPLLWEESIGSNHVLIYEKRGQDVDTLFKSASNHFSPITTAMIFHLSVCALEKVHSKKIIHTNLKPSKLLTNSNGDLEHKIYLSGLEFCERLGRAINKSQKTTEIKAKKSNENIFSSIGAHQNQNIGYRDDLEALGYIICHLFSDGKLFVKFPANMTDNARKLLIKLKTNIRAEPLLTNMPSEFGDYFKYIQKLKNEDMPDFQHIKTLSFKLCQKLYVKNDIVSCFDWVDIPEDQRNSYRAKMLSYFFCNPQSSKKIKAGTMEDILFNQKKRPAHVTKALVQQLQPDDYFKKNFQNMPILETQEEQNATKYYLDGFQLELDEEYSSCPTTPRLATKDKVFISKNTKMDKYRPTTTEEVKLDFKQETLKEKTVSSSESVDSVKSLEESKLPSRSVPVNLPKTHQGILMSLTMNVDDRTSVPKIKHETFTASKSLSQTTLKEYKSQLSVPSGQKPEKSKLTQK